jgi:hypothetical protein
MSPVSHKALTCGHARKDNFKFDANSQADTTYHKIDGHNLFLWQNQHSQGRLDKCALGRRSALGEVGELILQELIRVLQEVPMVLGYVSFL